MKKFYDGQATGGGGIAKPYFTKYLPVEGEVKEGDMALKPSFKYKGMFDQDLTMEPYIEQVDEFELEEDKSKEYKKVKLFLCSRDIQVGDVAINEQGKNFDVHSDMLRLRAEGKEFTNLFKVIGEISPDALGYVKENQQFAEDEIKVSEGPICPKCGAMYGNDGFCPYNGDCETKQQRIIVYIKGDCTYFH